MARLSASPARLSAPRIEAAALRLIARDGSAMVSMRQVAAELGVQVGALYNHVADKQALLVRLMNNALDAADAAWGQVPGAGDPSGRLDALVSAHLRFALDRPDLAFLPAREMAALAPAAQEAAQARIAARCARLERILQDGKEAGHFRLPDAGLLIVAILSAIEGVARWAPDAGLPRERVERMTLNIVRRMVPRGGK